MENYNQAAINEIFGINENFHQVMDRVLQNANEYMDDSISFRNFIQIFIEQIEIVASQRVIDVPLKSKMDLYDIEQTSLQASPFEVQEIISEIVHHDVADKSRELFTEIEKNNFVEAYKIFQQLLLHSKASNMESGEKALAIYMVLNYQEKVPSNYKLIFSLSELANIQAMHQDLTEKLPSKPATVQANKCIKL